LICTIAFLATASVIGASKLVHVDVYNEANEKIGDNHHNQRQ
jgi:hypothetical protein